MNGSNRRTFFKTAGVGAAAAGAVALAPSALSATSAGRPTGTPATPVAALPPEASGSMVAYIHDVASGEVSVMVEGREVTVTDHQLVAKIATALHSSTQL